jgi:predicted protein tyrosine phosphatase
MKQIRALPKMVFDERFNNELFKSYSFGAFISILDCDNSETKYDTTMENFLQVKMWDIEEDVYQNDEIQYQKPSDSELQRIVDFINKHNDKSSFIIYCSAGISRSGAVEIFLFDKFLMEIDKEVFRRENKFIRPNLYVLNRLKNLDLK